MRSFVAEFRRRCLEQTIMGHHWLRPMMKYTVGAYYLLPTNFTLVADITDTTSESHDGVENDATTFNIGAYLSF
jgi:hypothetical protein